MIRIAIGSFFLIIAIYAAFFLVIFLFAIAVAKLIDWWFK